MTTSNNITPGMTISVGGKLFRVESSVKVTVAKGTPFIKAKLVNLLTDQVVERNFKPSQKVEVVSLDEKCLEFLYPEGKEYLFFDIEELENVTVADAVVGERANFLKEGVEVKALFHGDTVFSIELPQFLELMVVSIEEDDGSHPVSDNTTLAVLETGAKIFVPSFIDIGDIIKIDAKAKEFIQRV